jgi:flagellar biosynthetic protein FliR
VSLTIPAGFALPQIAGTNLVAFVLVLGRIGPMFTLAPVFSASLIGTRAKFLTAAAITMALTPIAAHGQTIPTDPIGFALALAKEVGVGLVFALALGVISAAVVAGASLVDTTVGFSFGAILDPVTGVQNAVLGQVYSIFAIMVFLLSGGVQLMILGIARTYDLIPLGAFPKPSTLAGIAMHALEQVPIIGFEVVAPVLLAVFVTDAVFGLLARTVPQMNVFVVALPLKVIVAFAVVAVSLPLVGQHLTGDLTNAVSQTLQALSH